MSRSAGFVLHLVTDRHRLSGGADFQTARRCLLEQARYAIEAGIGVLQVRERDLDAAILANIVRDIVKLATGSRTRVVVNDRLDVALAAGASGVHLRSDSFLPAVVRDIAPPGFLIGRSIHSAAEAAAVAASVDYFIAGTVWPTPSKAEGHPMLGPEGLAQIARTTSVPVVAIGGVTIERFGLIRAAGARGAAAIGMFMGKAGEGMGRMCRAIPLGPIVEEASRDA